MQDILDNIKDGIIKNGFLVGVALILLAFFTYLLTEENDPLFIWFLIPGGIATFVALIES